MTCKDCQKALARAETAEKNYTQLISDLTGEFERGLEQRWQKKNIALFCTARNKKCKKHPNRFWCASWQGYRARTEDESNDLIVLRDLLEKAEARVRELEVQLTGARAIAKYEKEKAEARVKELEEQLLRDEKTDARGINK